MRTALGALVLTIVAVLPQAAVAQEAGQSRDHNGRGRVALGAEQLGSTSDVEIHGQRLVPIVAVTDGKVADVKRDETSSSVLVSHDYGWATQYSSAAGKGAPSGFSAEPFTVASGIEPGKSVGAGELIGWVGDSSATSFELLRNGSRVVKAPKLASFEGWTVAERILPQFKAMWQAAKEDGITLEGWGYRSSATQIWLRRSHCGTSPHEVWQKPSAQCSPPTATPGNSMHEIGEALDFKGVSFHSHPVFQWLAEHAAEYGFYNLPSEPWHWSTNGK